jgi:hypothetical protein
MPPVVADVLLFQLLPDGMYQLIGKDTGKQMGFRVDILLVVDRTYIQVGFQAAKSTFYLTDCVVYLSIFDRLIICYLFIR